MECNERDNLWDEYQRSLDALSASIYLSLGTYADAGLATKSAGSEEANATYRSARRAWIIHVAEHKCCRHDQLAAH